MAEPSIRVQVEEVRAAVEALGIRILAGPHLHEVRARDASRTWCCARVKCYVDYPFAIHVLRATPAQARGLSGGRSGVTSLRFQVDVVPGGVRLTWRSSAGRKRITRSMTPYTRDGGHNA